jgi:hypothetical protein
LVVGLELGHAPSQVFQFVDEFLPIFVMIHHGRAPQIDGARPKKGGARKTIIADGVWSLE